MEHSLLKLMIRGLFHKTGLFQLVWFVVLILFKISPTNWNKPGLFGKPILWNNPQMRERDSEQGARGNRLKNRCFRTLILKLVNPLESLEDRIVIYIWIVHLYKLYMSRFLRATLDLAVWQQPFLFSKAAQRGTAPLLHVYVNFRDCDVTNPGSNS